MRGFPLLNALAVVTFFVLAWWPLQKVTGNRPLVVESTPASEAVEGEPFTLRITVSHALEAFTCSHLDRPLFTLDAGESLEIEQRVTDVEIPSEGIEFWIDAKFSQSLAENQRAAISIELIPDDPERTPKVSTLWGSEGESEIEDLAVFLWQSESKG